METLFIGASVGIFIIGFMTGALVSMVLNGTSKNNQ